ncbi:MAG: HU family DNA-binding protein [Bacteroidales bacterium]
MAIRYVRVQRNIQVGATPGIKFLARQVKNDTVSFDQIAERVQAHSSLTKADVYGSFMQAVEEIKHELMEGNPVQLGELGTVYPTFNAKAMTNLESVDASSISKPKLRFLFSKKLRDMMKSVPLVLDRPEEIKGLQ